jgi:aspartyl protease family protein
MARAYLIIIIVGAIIGAMLPSGPPSHPVAQTSSSRSVLEIARPNARNSYSNAAPASATPSIGGPWTTLERGPGGHFFADVQVNGMTVHFLVDTGASGVALTTEDARRVGLQFSPYDFTPIGSGASGPVRGKMVMLDRVTLGGRTIENVEGAVIEGGEMSLLGQSFLTRIGSIEMNGDRMVIR